MGPVVTGSPTTVADKLQDWIEEADADGFSERSINEVEDPLLFLPASFQRHRLIRAPLVRTDLCYAISPGTFEDIVDYLVPELQARGVHWKE